MDLQTKIDQLTKVGKTTASRLRNLGINNVYDLLYYFPFRYEDYSKIIPVNKLADGQIVTVKGKIELINNKRSFRTHKVITEALLNDHDDVLRVVWFNQPFIIKNLRAGDTVYLSGKVKMDVLGPQLVSPIYEKVSKQTKHTARMVPIYSTTHGLTQKQLRFLVSQSMKVSDLIDEWLDSSLMDQVDLMPITEAIKGIHYPLDQSHLDLCLKRLKFDELFLLHLRSVLTRKKRKQKKTHILEFQENKIKKFVSKLPFKLTDAQRRSAWEILQDLEKNIPMNRLLSGDVGAGKTVVAAMAMLDASLNGKQAILMAPTEILAQQHFESLSNYLAEEAEVVLLTQSSHKTSQESQALETKASQKRKILKQIQTGGAKIIIGTQALLSKGVKYNSVGLVIVDEQHRFGVEQRKQLKEKGSSVHFLSMTATPIPRSLALTVYGDLDYSVIDEKPKNRKPVLTRVVEETNRSKAYDFIKQKVKNGQQVFVVCPLIEQASIDDNNPESMIITPALEKKTVMAEYEKLSKNIFPDLKIDFLHGRLKADEKEFIMNNFKEGKIDVLVSTSVIEVGVDIPNATIMMIEGSERFGLAQLHQFRGRVGRSDLQSYCFLFIDQSSGKVKERLVFFEKNNDGFKLAEKDLQIRGPGDVYGCQQSGVMDLKLARLTDHELIKQSRLMSKQVINSLNDYPLINKRLKKMDKDIHWE